MSTLTPEAKKKLAHTIRAVREQLLLTLDDEAKRTYRLAVPIGKAGLDEAPRRRRERRGSGGRREHDKLCLERHLALK